MAVGFASLSGGDTVSFDLDSNQAAAVQDAIYNLSANDGASEISSVRGGPWQNPADFNVYNLDGGTNVAHVRAGTDAVVLDSVNGSTATRFSGTYDHPMLWVGNQGNDTFSINGTGQTIIAGDGDNTIKLTGGGQVIGGEVNVGDGNNRIITGAGRPAQSGGQGVGGQSGNGGEDGERSGGQHGHDDDHDGGGHTTGGGNAAGAMTVIAGSGNDNLTLGRGTFDVTLGGGNDSVTLGHGSATISNSGGSTLLDATQSTGLDYTGAGTDMVLLGTGSSSVVETGSATVTGGSRQSEGGSAPHATVQGGSGSFVFIGHDGNDMVTAGSGFAMLMAGSGNDTFNAGASSNALLDARGEGGHDVLYGGSGSATLFGGSGSDSFFGGSGNTSMVGGSSWNFFTGGSGNDTMAAHTVSTNPGRGEDEPGVDQNVFNFDAAVGGNHQIKGYNSTAPGGDTDIHLSFTNYGLTPDQIVADSKIVGHDTVITLPGAGGNPTTTITIKDFTGVADWNVNSH